MHGAVAGGPPRAPVYERSIAPRSSPRTTAHRDSPSGAPDNIVCLSTTITTGAPVSRAHRRLLDVVSLPHRKRWWVEVLALVWLLWIYDAITNLAPLRLQ